MLCIVLFVSLISCASNTSLPQLRIIILTFGACEARLGLRIIVLISRTYGSDKLNSLTINKC